MLSALVRNFILGVEWAEKKLLRLGFDGAYIWRYRITHAIYRIKKLFGKMNPEYDLVFIVPKNAQGWILEGICREIAAHHPGKWAFHYGLKAPPMARAYHVCLYSYLPKFFRFNPQAWGAKVTAWYTHPRPLPTPAREMDYAFSLAHKVVCTCRDFVLKLNRSGVSEKKTVCVLGGADPSLFPPHKRGAGAVGFSTAYYERKNPDLVLELVKALPARRFILIGRNWRDYPRFSELAACPNFAYAEAEYGDYPRFYAEMDVFVSPAKLEGGPIPLIEAMMSNAVPVASRTGFAPDIIRHGENGFLFEPDTATSEVAALIERAFELTADIRSTVEHLSWKNFSKAYQAVLEEPALR